MSLFFIILLIVFGIIVLGLLYKFVFSKYIKNDFRIKKINTAEFSKDNKLREEEIKRLREKYSEKSKNNDIPVSKSITNLKLQLKSYNDLLENIEDSELKKVLAKAYSLDSVSVSKIIIERVFSTIKELEDYTKDNIIAINNERYYNLKYKISDLTKKGLDVKEIRIKLMPYPLKTKILKSNFNVKEYDRVISILDETEKRLKPFEEKK